MQKFPLAVIGAGVINRTHIDRILRTPEFTPVVEPSPAGRRWCIVRNIPVFENHLALLDATRPQGVVIAALNATHVDVAADCMARGIAALITLIHEIAMLLLLLSDVLAVRGNLYIAAKGCAVEDTGSALFGLACGTQGSLSLPDLALWHSPGDCQWQQKMMHEQSRGHELDVDLQQLCRFRAVAEQRHPPICSALDGWRTLQATQTLLHVAQTGQRQTCPAFIA